MIISATGLLADFSEAGIIDAAGVHLGRTLARLCGERRPEAMLAAALCVAAQQSGSVCLSIDEQIPIHFPRLTPGSRLNWPKTSTWLDILSSSPMVSVGADDLDAARPLRLVGPLLYLERAWVAESMMTKVLTERWNSPRTSPPPTDPVMLTERVADRFLPGRTSLTQRRAVVTAVSAATSVISGGPGTGKTTTIALLLKVLDELGPHDVPLTVSLASFTGKAAARMQESLDQATAGFGEPTWRRLRIGRATTLHSLLGSLPHRGFRHGPDNPLSCDLLVIDETSMVSLQLMTTVLTSLLPTTRLVMVGDAGQLSSVDAGAVLADLVSTGMSISAVDARPAVVELTESHRFTGSIADLATSVRNGDVVQTLDILESEATGVEWLEMDPNPSEITSSLPGLRDEILDQASEVLNAAQRGDASAGITALDRHRLLCAHRHGRYGAMMWSAAIEEMLRVSMDDYALGATWYPGRPVLVTRNVPELGIANGDTGVVVRQGSKLQVGLAGGAGVQLLSPMVLEAVETLHAMTIHKSQGSEYDAVSVILPSADSPMLVRELIYTAITRARHQVRIIGTREAITKAVSTPARRASGLADRLRLRPESSAG
ncbi:exodeoxyribonuclease V, alpha subunit [Propionibacterium sp. oral taxon 192 str. F0372]|uniref:exodeoxyribonuclease V subunit alpha n=1 Tax=Propionibacterium sp. oral taxon 192 TaxID=671222 RepID=UPI0003528E39|nr:exodeoxyribonuclease V subunit alpha [Propionibacterium sp. oral taxon 192]EPH00348.1 exodeoxyribonuclease V, alpha subunit [Propionibacterium sp. oral taxon 192 str. F0372]